MKLMMSRVDLRADYDADRLHHLARDRLNNGGALVSLLSAQSAPLFR